MILRSVYNQSSIWKAYIHGLTTNYTKQDMLQKPKCFRVSLVEPSLTSTLISSLLEKLTIIKDENSTLEKTANGNTVLS